MPAGFYERTPEMRAQSSAARIGIPHTTPDQLAADDAQRGVSHSLEHNAAITKGMQESDIVGVYERTPEHNAAMSKSMSESEAFKSAAEARRGGNDIVNHHIIYDHSDMSKNIIRMTRSMHTTLHNLFRKNGIEIPHINIKEA